MKVPAAQRGILMNKLADLMDAHFDELCALEALDNGSSPSPPFLSFCE